MGRTIQITEDFSSEIMEVRGQCKNVFWNDDEIKEASSQNCISSENITTKFTHSYTYRKLKEFITSRCALNETMKGFLQIKGNDPEG